MCVRHTTIYLPIECLHIIMEYVLYFKCSGESLAFYILKKWQLYTCCKSHNLSIFCYHYYSPVRLRICKTLSYIQGNYKSTNTYKRVIITSTHSYKNPGSNQAILLLLHTAKREQVSQHSALKTRVKGGFCECQPQVFVLQWTKQVSHKT